MFLVILIQKIKNVDALLRLRILRYWGKPCYLKRVNAHASGVNYLLQFLMISSNSPIVRYQESKVDVPVFCLYFVFAMLP